MKKMKKRKKKRGSQRKIRTKDVQEDIPQGSSKKLD